MKPDSTGTAANATGPTPHTAGELNELALAPGYAEAALNEFPEGASEFTDEPSRRRFMTLMGASVALATGAGCNLRPASQRKIVPYTTQPDEITLGVPLFFASAAPLGGYGQGVLVRSSEGRPTKVEGNPDHPSSLGGAGIHALASVLDLYDPDRSRTVTHRGIPTSYEQAIVALRAKLFRETARAENVRIRIVTETVTSPTLAGQIGQLLNIFNQKGAEAQWVTYDAVSSQNARDGLTKAFGKPVGVHYDFNKADVVVAIDSDFLCSGPGSTRYSRDFSDRRKIREGGKNAAEIAAGRQKGQPFKEGVQADALNRLYAFETMPTNTGAIADHRLAMTNAQVVNFARTLAAALGVPGATAGGEWSEDQKKLVAALADDLKSRGTEGKDKKRAGGSIVIAGDHLPASVHTIVAAINQHLGNVGQTVHYTAPVEANVAGRMGTIQTLTADLAAKNFDVLLLLGAVNPAYSAPAELDFAAKLQAFAEDKSKLTLHLGSHVDETSVLCEWHVPEAHYLETWGDIRGHDGTVAIQQPLIAPLHGGHSALELIAALTRPAATGVPGAPRDPLDIVKSTWSGWFEGQKKTGSFEVFWQETVRKGVVDGTAFGPETVTIAGNLAEAAPAVAPVGGDYEINIRACPSLYDGRYANNGWLQELPKPHTKISWDNAAFMSQKTANALGVKRSYRWTGGEHGRAEVSVVEIDVGGRKVKAPAWILPDHADGAITVHLGHGRLRAGRVGNAEGHYNVNAEGEQARGFNVYKIRTSAAPWVAAGKVSNTTATYFLACTQGHWSMIEKDPISGKPLDRKPVRRGSLADYRQNPNFAKIPPMATGETGLINENVPQPLKLGQHVPGPHGQNGHDHAHAGHDHGSDDKPAKEDPNHARIHPLNMYNPAEGLSPDLRDSQRRRWAMAIDLNACTGCSACVVACQSENNIPVVGKEQVSKAREMYWISIDRYYDGNEADPNAVKAYFQPRNCVQCENAPCEIVCPVGATVHSVDGLNDMTYNRCVGTRYCSNNCPYKVRRFNFLTFDAVYTWDDSTVKLGRNPDVTVRSRGVMEKCTFCVQRLRGAEIVAERELAQGLRKAPDQSKGEMLIKDGEILTACQAACPSGAIVFGDINDPNAAVSKWKHEPTSYGLLAELNTRPRLTHMAVVRNPNPALVKA
jgi:molybdopterin-containing oxidoreductase family iron-sulfur binding subunit